MINILLTPALDTEMLFIRKAYCRAVLTAGGYPFMPVYPEHGFSQEYVDWLVDISDGVLLSGGGDIHADFLKEELHPMANTIFRERDELELALCRRAIALDKPVLAICRGAQLLNIAADGGLLQHVEGHVYNDRRGEEVHQALIKKDSRLFEILQTEQVGVNSLHHQAVGQLGEGITVSARAEDGIIEAVEMKEKTFMIGVQWHPEALSDISAIQMRLFLYFIEACNKNKKE